MTDYAWDLHLYLALTGILLIWIWSGLSRRILRIYSWKSQLYIWMRARTAREMSRGDVFNLWVDCISGLYLHLLRSDHDVNQFGLHSDLCFLQTFTVSRCVFFSWIMYKCIMHNVPMGSTSLCRLSGILRIGCLCKTKLCLGTLSWGSIRAAVEKD